MSNTAKDKIIGIFASHPAAKELYIDANGQIWTTIQAARDQSKGRKFEVIKRTTNNKKTTTS